MQFVDTRLYKFFSHPLIGRPLRKFSWLTLKILYFVHNRLESLYWNMPFVTEVSKNSSEPDKIEQFNLYVNYLNVICDALPIKPKISVLVPLYKVEDKYFQETLESIALQGYKNWELCIVDDCSKQTSL